MRRCRPADQRRLRLESETVPVVDRVQRASTKAEMLGAPVGVADDERLERHPGTRPHPHLVDPHRPPRRRIEVEQGVVRLGPELLSRVRARQLGSGRKLDQTPQCARKDSSDPGVACVGAFALEPLLGCREPCSDPRRRKERPGCREPRVRECRLHALDLREGAQVEPMHLHGETPSIGQLEAENRSHAQLAVKHACTREQRDQLRFDSPRLPT